MASCGKKQELRFACIFCLINLQVLSHFQLLSLHQDKLVHLPMISVVAFMPENSRLYILFIYCLPCQRINILPGFTNDSAVVVLYAEKMSKKSASLAEQMM